MPVKLFLHREDVVAVSKSLGGEFFIAGLANSTKIVGAPTCQEIGSAFFKHNASTLFKGTLCELPSGGRFFTEIAPDPTLKLEFPSPQEVLANRGFRWPENVAGITFEGEEKSGIVSANLDGKVIATFGEVFPLTAAFANLCNPNSEFFLNRKDMKDVRAAFEKASNIPIQIDWDKIESGARASAPALTVPQIPTTKVVAPPQIGVTTPANKIPQISVPVSAPKEKTVQKQLEVPAGLKGNALKKWRRANMAKA